MDTLKGLFRFNKFSKNRVVDFQDKSLISKEQQDFLPADKIEVIPQFNGTCWFNAILMAMLYSQGLRSFVYNKAKLWASLDNDLKNNKFKKTLLFILKHNYKNPEKIKELFQRRVKPEFLLFSYLDYYHSSDKISSFYKELLNNLNEVFFGLYAEFINEIFSKVFKNTLDYLDIYFIDGNLYLGKSKASVFDSGIDISSLNPNVLLLYHQDFFDSTILKEAYYKILSTVKVEDAYQLPGTIHHKGIDTYQQTITFNGHTYQLDCCIINNYNTQAINRGHTIIGLTYDNQPYVYNGWTNATPSKTTYEYGKKSKEACKLFFLDWKNDLYLEEGSGGFCISRFECDSLKEIDEKDLCFDFSKKKDRKILIYVKVEDESKKLLPATSSLVLTSSNTPEKLDYSSSSIENYIEKYHKLKGKTFEQLSELFVQKTSYNIQEITLLLITPGLENYKILFFILCGRRLSNPITEEDKKAILIALLELYLKDDKIILFNFLSDDTIHEYLTEETLETILKKIGYTHLSEEIKEDERNKFYLEHLFLYRSLLFSHPISISTEQQQQRSINVFLFNFLLMRTFILNRIYFNLVLYTDTNIINAVKSNELTMEDFYKKTSEIERTNLSTPAYWLLASMNEKIKEILTDYQPENHLKISITFYFMNIKSLNELMEPTLLTVSNIGQAGGFRKRQLKSYKKVNK